MFVVHLPRPPSVCLAIVCDGRLTENIFRLANFVFLSSSSAQTSFFSLNLIRFHKSRRQFLASDRKRRNGSEYFFFRVIELYNNRKY